MLLEGALAPKGGVLCPDRGVLGHGLAFKRSTAEQFRTG